MKVSNVLGEERWQGSDGTQMVTYEVALEGYPQTVKAYRPAGSEAPQVGDEGDVDTSGKSPKFVRARNDAPASKGGSDNFARRSEHPENATRMRHSAALSVAPTLYEQMRTEGVIDSAKDKAGYLDTLAGIVTWVEASYPTVDDPAEVPF